MIEYKAPEIIQQQDKNKFQIFLGGSIEMGVAEEWQQYVVFKLSKYDDIVLLNPRRKEWDSSWKQDITNEKFREQVTWELDHLENCDLIFMYLSPETKSPISLLEIGLMAEKKKMIIICPKGFWRRGNIQIISNRYIIPMVDTLDDGINLVIKEIHKANNIKNQYK